MEGSSIDSGLSFTTMCIGLDRIMTFTDKNMSAYKDLASYFKKRYSLEEEFLRHLQKATKSTEDHTREAGENGSEIVKNCEEILKVAGTFVQMQYVGIAALVDKVQEPSKDLEAHVKKVWEIGERLLLFFLFFSLFFLLSSSFLLPFLSLFFFLFFFSFLFFLSLSLFYFLSTFFFLFFFFLQLFFYLLTFLLSTQLRNDKEKFVKQLKATYAIQTKARAKYSLVQNEYTLAVQQNLVFLPFLLFLSFFLFDLFFFFFTLCFPAWR